jgi:hypothetical protein
MYNPTQDSSITDMAPDGDGDEEDCRLTFFPTNTILSQSSTGSPLSIAFFFDPSPCVIF